MINDSGIFLLKNKEPFDRQELFRVLEEQYKGLSLASYKLKMQRLLESGEIARVGRNLYCIPDHQAPVYDYECFFLRIPTVRKVCGGNQPATAGF
jgi:hypothetical protein